MHVAIHIFMAVKVCKNSMTLGRLMYKSLLRITGQYDVNRLPLTGVVGFTETRFKYPASQLFREAVQSRAQTSDFDGESRHQEFAVKSMLTIQTRHRRLKLRLYLQVCDTPAAGFRAIKQLQAQYSVLEGAGPIEQVGHIAEEAILL